VSPSFFLPDFRLVVPERRRTKKVSPSFPLLFSHDTDLANYSAIGKTLNLSFFFTIIRSVSEIQCAEATSPQLFLFPSFPPPFEIRGALPDDSCRACLLPLSPPLLPAATFITGKTNRTEFPSPSLGAVAIRCFNGRGGESPLSPFPKFISRESVHI